MTYDDYVSDQQDEGKRINYTRKQYNTKFYNMKRGRTNGGGPAYKKARTGNAPFKKRTYFRQGYDRTGGFYGRYGVKSGELKFHDLDIDNTIIESAGFITPSLNLIAQGVTESERVGRKCTIKSLHWKYMLSLPSNLNNDVADTVRLIIYQDKQCNGATAAVLDIIETADYQSFRNLANTGRFNILMDRTHDVLSAPLGSDGTTMKTNITTQSYSWNKKCNIPLEFSGTTGVITEIRSNNIGLLVISILDETNLDSKFRVRFSDGA